MRKRRFTCESLLERLKNCRDIKTGRVAAAVPGRGGIQGFPRRHDRDTVRTADIGTYTGDAWLGIDCGSTTTKLTLISADREILYSYYSSNLGNPVRRCQRRA